ncbi:MAG: hypothetical protein LBK50_03745 [Candidatus Nomurabacteria bacterium]|nr:hypothetical protein [Candidatus Nomurabacteria bacterium]
MSNVKVTVLVLIWIAQMVSMCYPLGYYLCRWLIGPDSSIFQHRESFVGTCFLGALIIVLAIVLFATVWLLVFLSISRASLRKHAKSAEKMVSLACLMPGIVLLVFFWPFFLFFGSAEQKTREW